MACFHDCGVQISHFCPYDKGTPSPFHEHVVTSFPAAALTFPTRRKKLAGQNPAACTFGNKPFTIVPLLVIILILGKLWPPTGAVRYKEKG
jgi:hypothetical protein